MQTGNRAANATRAAAANSAAAQRRAAASPSLSNKASGGGGSSVVLKLLFLAILGGAGYFGWKQFAAYKARPKPPPPPPKQVVAFEEPPPPPPPPQIKPKPQKPKRVVRRREVIESDEEIIRRFDEEERRRREKENDPAEIKRRAEEAERLRKEADERALARLAETQSARKAAEEQIAAARQAPDAKPLPGLKGIRFGTAMDGQPSVWGAISPKEGADGHGVAYAFYGPEVSKPIGTLGNRPLVWVTPRTKRVFRIEFFRPLKPEPKSPHDAETASLVGMMETALKAKAVCLHPPAPELPGAEYAIPAADTTLRIGEFGGKLKLIAESETLAAEAETEAKAQAGTVAADESGDDLLVCAKYPAGPVVNYKGLGLVSRFREGTPKTFCGIVFGRTPPEGARIENPKHGEKCFYLDYALAKCPVFKGFAFGRADIDRYRGGIFAVTLYNSDGACDGLGGADFFKSVRDALDRQYLVKPEEKPGTKEFPELVYRKGDVSITFAPDKSGGFRLSAENHMLADIAKIPPDEPAAKRGRR